MGLREDLETMELHKQAGTLKEWFEGTAPPVPKNNPIDISAARPTQDTYKFITRRGD